ncbi:uncharacterized protein Triagg1_9691 [Trichoderma aggressivum f. europaeum]|uniref:Carrier domain-containing protein n=1 Tax=Trichoderma aggressivum f. europaeum TaxID=173218 RepID=A0AAE1I6L1_9HYPO|nr:hypothetical protein Triagg1_9691 [Trichoderma aggressivum f. europaeum]
MATSSGYPIHSTAAGSTESPNDDVISQQLLFNSANVEAVEDCVHNVISMQTLRNPDQLAISSWDMELTYKQLDEKSTILASYLSTIGVGPEKLVSLCFEKSAWTVIAMLAVMKAGGAFVPMDAAFPEMRIKQIISEVDTDIVLVSPTTQAAFNGYPQRIVVICQELLDSLDPQSTLLYPASPSNAVYVIFTSGSTGKPKGILMEHRNFCSGASGHATALKLTPGCRVLQISSYIFDASLVEILTTLMVGGCICIPDEHTRVNDLVGFINDKAVDYAIITPSLARTIQPSSVPTLKTLVLAGEAMMPDDIKTWANKLALVNGYGPSECAVCCSSNLNVTLATIPTNIGKSISTCRCWIVHPDDPEQLLGPGCDGELLVEGPILARGYLNDEERTKNTFIDAPQWLKGIIGDNSQYSRLYKTGDIARYDENGSLIFVGRKDTQVKLRGQRVSLPEIENQLLKHDRVQHGLVLFPRSGPFSGRLVAVIHTGDEEIGLSETNIQFYTSSDRKNKLIGSIDAHLATELAPYMIPTVYAVLSSVPLLQSGKLDRKQVLSYVTEVPESTMRTLANSILQSNSIPEGDSLAMSLSGEVASLLSKHIDSSLYSVTYGWDIGLVAAGIDSISAISLRRHILETYHATISVKTILHPDSNITSLAELIRTEACGEAMEQDPNFDIDFEVQKSFGDWLENIKPQSLSFHGKKLDGYKTVFLTGGTGYLGSHILFQLLMKSEIAHVALHVRADSEGHAREKLITSAMAAGWWRDEFESRIEIWLGDLSLPHLGLDDLLWSKLKEGEIDTIVHNGCDVNWHKDYDSLRSTNVLSTFTLLQAVEQAVLPMNFVYVSARMEDATLDMKQTSNEALGYIQTKIASERLIQEYLKRDPTRKQCFTVARPSLIIGTPSNGVANVDDFIWRLTVGAVETQCFPLVDQESWLFMSDVGSVAEEIALASIYGNPTSDSILKFENGIPVSEFWSIIASATNTKLRPVEMEEWIVKLTGHTEGQGGDHPLWAVQSFLPSAGRYFEAKSPSNHGEDGSIRDAVRMNVMYLMEIGYLRSKHVPSGGNGLGSKHVFKRNKKVN